MAGLGPAIHDFEKGWQVVDAQPEAGHDELDYAAAFFGAKRP
jgi:streptomycin 6-kinase